MTVKVLVTGACGYIGRHVVRTALDIGCVVVANDCNIGDVDKRAKFVDMDIFNDGINLYHILDEPDIIIHLAWKDGFVHNSQSHMKYLSKHVSFLQEMIDSGVKSLTVMGSMHEVGYWKGAITADTPCNPLSQYGIAKNALRQSMLLYTEGKSTSLKWLRGFYIFGDDLYGNSIFAKLVQAEKEGRNEFPFTSGKNKNDFISVELLAKQIVASSLQNRVSGIINVCTGKPLSLAQQVEEYIVQNGFKIKLAYNTYPDRQYDSPAVWGDTAKIDEIMNSFRNTNS